MRSLVIMTALMVAAGASAALAQRGDLAVEQLPAPVGGRAVPQLGASGPTDSPAPTIQGQISSARSGREPAVRQVAPRAAGATPTSQLADRNVNQRINALPPGLVDACARAAEGRGTPPPGVDCATLVEAAPPPPPISAEEALLTTDDERAAQRMASERQSRGQTPDAAEVARRLSAGDISNSPVAQAVAAQAASDAIANSQQAPGNTPVIVPGGGTVVVPRGN
ncbi:hypothetical protein [Sphingobium bisphenolivorans]|uniref:hypothetical protein n=1 Tax=Sphingobium bisphenolivorans TaxID=1335760 RepID=UPI0003A4AEFD|nr:hypothetical protein [Sphingobium bisphenolivorans]